MKATIVLRPTKAAHSQTGFILATGMLFLVIVTLLALALFRSSGLLERISANTRDKQRAFESAQAALQYGEWWLGNTTSLTKNACTTTGQTVASLQICSTALSTSSATVAALAWAPNAFTYTPPNMTIAATGTPGGLTTSQTDINYSAPPGVYLEDLGLMPDGKSELYQVTAYGYGGSPDTVSVVRSTYKVTSTTNCLSCTP